MLCVCLRIYKAMVPQHYPALWEIYTMHPYTPDACVNSCSLHEIHPTPYTMSPRVLSLCDWPRASSHRVLCCVQCRSAAFSGVSVCRQICICSCNLASAANAALRAQNGGFVRGFEASWEVRWW